MEPILVDPDCPHQELERIQRVSCVSSWDLENPSARQSEPTTLTSVKNQKVKSCAE